MAPINFHSLIKGNIMKTIHKSTLFTKVKKQKSPKVLTKEQFRNQFPQKCDVSGVLDILQLDSITHGYEIYRALNLLILKDENEYFCTGR